MSYRSESASLDHELLERIETWHTRGHPMSETAFNGLALRLFAYQLEYNEPYARYCCSRGVTDDCMPSTWQEIPAVPAAAFKETALATFDPAAAALSFETSGTTRGTSGRHYMEGTALYDNAALAAFDRFVLGDGAKLRFFNCVPNPVQRPQSSLGHMMAHVASERGHGTGWYVGGDVLLIEAFLGDVRDAIERGQAICMTTTAFALAQLLDEIEANKTALPLPSGSRIVETGGFKGRKRIIPPTELYERTSQAFNLPLHAILSEYGMTELSSQYYDAPTPRGTPEVRRKVAPPWLRCRVVGHDGRDLPDGTIGALVHVDLANRSSCIAIATEDLGVNYDDGLRLVGREAGAPLRGCSLDAERLLPR